MSTQQLLAITNKLWVDINKDLERKEAKNKVFQKVNTI